MIEGYERCLGIAKNIELPPDHSHSFLSAKTLRAPPKQGTKGRKWDIPDVRKRYI